MTFVRVCQYSIMLAGAVLVLMALFIPNADQRSEKVVTWVAGVCILTVLAGLVGLGVSIL